MEHKEAIHLWDLTNRGVDYNVVIHEIDAIFSTFQTIIFLISANNFNLFMMASI